MSSKTKKGSSWIDQMRISLWRNTILQSRYWQSTLAQALLAPFIFTLLIFVLQQADYANQSKTILYPPISTLSGLSPCQGRNPGDPCITLMYYPASTVNGVDYNAIINKFSELNALRTGRTLSVTTTPSLSIASGPTSSIDIIAVSSPDFIYDYTLKYPNTTAWGVTFSSTGSGSSLNVQYQVWYNATATQNATALTTDIFGRNALSMTRGLDEAISNIFNFNSWFAHWILVSYLNNKNADISIELKDWPTIPNSYLSDSIVQSLGPVFYFCSMMIIFINVLNTVVSEKEFKLRHGMELMGLKPNVYWISQFLSNTLLVFCNALSTTIFGLIFQFQAFKNCNFAVMLITFFLFGLAMVSLAFFITTLVKETRQAILVGIVIIILGLLFESFVFSSTFIGYIWWSENTISPLGWQILIFVPFFNFGHMFLDITTFTTGKLDSLTDTFVPGPGFTWSTLTANWSDYKSLLVPYDGIYPAVPMPVQAWYFLLMNIVFYSILTWYFDAVIPDAFGSSRPLYFLFLPSYWGFSAGNFQLKKEEWLKQYNQIVNSEEYKDEDVSAERNIALNPNEWSYVKIANLKKVYSSRAGWKCEAVTKTAVAHSSLTFQQGKLLALLGQNGAGKSTTIAMLSGLTPATDGDALIGGFSVRKQILEIRDIMGICPQHDILFDDLTAKEHIQLYAGLKGIPPKDQAVLIEERLAAVRLDTVANVRAGTYSGGMKRRLSLVISTIGDPDIIFMDEPTTGMDPVNRRHVWSFIEKFKKGRVIVLTTHSMEEADVLGDRIAIMTKGKLKAIGNSIHLKNKYGTGYRISIVTDPIHSNDVKETVSRVVPGAKLEDDSAGALIYQFPSSSMSCVPDFVSWLEKSKGTIVKNWGISQSTLEEVFLKLVRDVPEDGLDKKNQ